MEVNKEIVIDLLDNSQPSLSSTSDMPVIETKPDSTPAAPAETEEVEASKTTPESATGHTETPGEPEEAKKPSRGVQKKLDELVKREADALRQVEAERQEKARILALLEQKSAPEKHAAEEKTLVRPDRSQYENTDAYEFALEQYLTAKAEDSAQKAIDKKLADQKAAQEKEHIESEAQKIREAYTQKVEKAKAKYADFESVAYAPDVMITQAMADALIVSDDGIDVAYHLGKNPDEAKRISSLPTAAQLVELGKIAAKLNTPVTLVSAAPKPIKPIVAGGDTVKTAEEESMEEYAARRSKELAAESRRGLRH